MFDVRNALLAPAAKDDARAGATAPDDVLRITRESTVLMVHHDAGLDDLLCRAALREPLFVESGLISSERQLRHRTLKGRRFRLFTDLVEGRNGGLQGQSARCTLRCPRKTLVDESTQILVALGAVGHFPCVYPQLQADLIDRRDRRFVHRLGFVQSVGLQNDARYRPPVAGRYGTQVTDLEPGTYPGPERDRIVLLEFALDRETTYKLADRLVADAALQPEQVLS